MEENKKWYESVTVWGGLVAVGAAVASSFGYDIDSGTQKEVAEYIVTVIGAIGGLVAIWGRLKANKVIK